MDDVMSNLPTLSPQPSNRSTGVEKSESPASRGLLQITGDEGAPQIAQSTVDMQNLSGINFPEQKGAIFATSGPNEAVLTAKNELDGNFHDYVPLTVENMSTSTHTTTTASNTPSTESNTATVTTPTIANPVFSANTTPTDTQHLLTPNDVSDTYPSPVTVSTPSATNLFLPVNEEVSPSVSVKSKGSVIRALSQSLTEFTFDEADVHDNIDENLSSNNSSSNNSHENDNVFENHDDNTSYHADSTSFLSHMHTASESHINQNIPEHSGVNSSIPINSSIPTETHVAPPPPPSSSSSLSPSSASMAASNSTSSSSPSSSDHSFVFSRFLNHQHQVESELEIKRSEILKLQEMQLQQQEAAVQYQLHLETEMEQMLQDKQKLAMEKDKINSEKQQLRLRKQTFEQESALLQERKRVLNSTRCTYCDLKRHEVSALKQSLRVQDSALQHSIRLIAQDGEKVNLFNQYINLCKYYKARYYTMYLRYKTLVSNTGKSRARANKGKQNSIEKVKTYVAQMERELTAARKELEESKEATAKLSSENQALRAKNIAQVEELKEMKEQSRVSRSEVSHRSQIEEFQAQIKAQLDSIVSQNRSYSTKVQQLQDLCMLQMNEITQSKHDAQLNSSVSSSSGSSTSSINDTELHSSLQAKELKVVALNNTVDELHGTIDSLKREIVLLQSGSSDLKAQQKEAHDKVSTQKSKRKAVADKYKALLEEKDGLERRLHSERANAQEYERKNGLLETRWQQERGMNEQHQDRIVQQERLCRSNHNNNNNHNNTNTSVIPGSNSTNHVDDMNIWNELKRLRKDALKKDEQEYRLQEALDRVESQNNVIALKQEKEQDLEQRYRVDLVRLEELLRYTTEKCEGLSVEKAQRDDELQQVLASREQLMRQVQILFDEAKEREERASRHEDARRSLEDRQSSLNERYLAMKRDLLKDAEDAREELAKVGLQLQESRVTAEQQVLMREKEQKEAFEQKTLLLEQDKAVFLRKHQDAMKQVAESTENRVAVGISEARAKQQEQFSSDKQTLLQGSRTALLSVISAVQEKLQRVIVESLYKFDPVNEHLAETITPHDDLVQWIDEAVNAVYNQQSSIVRPLPAYLVLNFGKYGLDAFVLQIQNMVRKLQSKADIYEQKYLQVFRQSLQQGTESVMIVGSSPRKHEYSGNSKGGAESQQTRLNAVEQSIDLGEVGSANISFTHDLLEPGRGQAETSVYVDNLANEVQQQSDNHSILQQITDQPIAEQPTTEQPTTEQPTTKQPTTEQVITEPVITELPTIEELSGVITKPQLPLVQPSPTIEQPPTNEQPTISSNSSGDITQDQVEESLNQTRLLLSQLDDILQRIEPTPEQAPRYPTSSSLYKFLE